MDEVFYEIKEIKPDNDLLKEIKYEIILNFLSKVEEYIVLYETTLELKKPNTLNHKEDKDIIEKLREIIHKTDSSITLVKGKIREIFLSYSS